MGKKNLERESLLGETFAQFERLSQWATGKESVSCEHGEVESYLYREGMELLRRMFQAHLDFRARGEEKLDDVKGSDLEVRTHRRSGSERNLETLFGSVVVRRIEYSIKERGCPNIYLGDGRLNLSMDKFSDGLRRRVAEESSKVAFDEAAKGIQSTTGAHVAKRQCEELTVKVAVDFEEFYATRSVSTTEKNTNSLLVLTTDSKGIVMNESDLRPATAKAARESEHKCMTRLSAGEKRNRKRMATVASVYGVERYVRTPEHIIGDLSEELDRPKVENKRVWASIEQSQEEVIASMFAEASKRDPSGKRERVLLVDGQPQQLKLVKQQIRASNVPTTIVLDLIHVMEYVWKAAFVFNASGTAAAEEWVQERILNILAGKAALVAAGMRRSATFQNIPIEQRKPVDACAEYLLNNIDYIRYNEYLRKGYPIATGVIEGACRHLVNDRMAITGARWRLERAEAVLKIRALRCSNDFDAYWLFHKQKEFIRNHCSKLQSPEIIMTA